jgi:CSLREA domain-containing protein
MGLLAEPTGRRRKWLLLAAIALVVLPTMGLPVLSRELIAKTQTPSQGGIFYSVNTTSDTVVIGACQNGNPGCSLRGAIQTANSHPGADGIGFDLPAGSVINLTAVLPDLTESVSIIGPGANLLTVRRTTGGSYRIFTVTTTGPVTFSGFTISDGQGGISNNNTATVTVNDSTLSGNVTASGLGGGIYNNSTGMIVVTNSTFSGNSAGSGGGIFNNSTGALRVTNSIFSANSATGASSNGGGICKNSGGTLDVTNSTFTGNSGSEGGGISASSTMNVTNCAFVNNLAHNGAALVTLVAC